MYPGAFVEQGSGASVNPVEAILARLGLGTAVNALGSANYRRYVIGNGVSQCGTWMQKVAVGWLAWQLTHSGAWLGVLATADLASNTLLGPIAGAFADRNERLRMARIVQLVAATQGTTLAILTVLGLVNIWVLFALALFQGFINAVDGPTRLSLVPTLVERPILSSALAINSVVFNMARFVGPILAGIAIARVGVALAFALNAASYIWFFVNLMRVHAMRDERIPSGRGLLRSTVEGVGYATRHPGIGPVLLLLIVTAIGLRGTMDLLPGFADAVFGRGAQGLAWLTASVGLGAMAGGTWMIKRGTGRGLPGVVILHLLLSAIAMGAFAATHWFWFGLASLVCAGFAMVVTGIGSQTLLQMAVEPSMRGRVLSLYGVIFRAAPALGTLLMGLASSYVGLQWPVLAAALLTASYWFWAHASQARVTEALEGGPAGDRSGAWPSERGVASPVEPAANDKAAE
jgi:MFS family permease